MYWAPAFAAGCEVHTATQMVGDGVGETHLPCRVSLALRAPRGPYLPGETRGHWIESENPRPHLCCNPARGHLSRQLPLLPQVDPRSHTKAPGATMAFITPAAVCCSLVALWGEGPDVPRFLPCPRPLAQALAHHRCSISI